MNLVDDVTHTVRSLDFLAFNDQTQVYTPGLLSYRELGRGVEWMRQPCARVKARG